MSTLRVCDLGDCTNDGAFSVEIIDPKHEWFQSRFDLCTEHTEIQAMLDEFGHITGVIPR